MIDPLELFPTEKVADALNVVGAIAGSKELKKTIEEKKKSLDPGERAIAGLASTATVAAVAVPTVINDMFLIPAAKKDDLRWEKMPRVQNAQSLGQVVEGTPPSIFSGKGRVLGLGEVTGRPRKIDWEHAGNVRGRMAEIQDTVDSFIRKNKLPEKGVTLGFSGGLGSGENQYVPATKRVHLNSVGKETVLHELGHAADATGSRLGALRYRLGPALETAVKAVVPMALLAGDQLREAIPGTVDDKAIRFLQDNATAVMGATMAATTLYPEAKASFLAIKHIKDVEGGAAARAALKKLVPAWGAYAISTIPILVGISLAKKYMQEAREERERASVTPEELKKTAGIVDVIRGTASGIGQAAKGLAHEAVESAKDIGHVGKQIGSLTVDMVKSPERVSRIAAAAKEVGTSPEFVHGALVTAIPATLGALYLYGTPGGEQIRGKLDPRDTEHYVKKPLGVTSSKDEAWRAENPLRFAGIVGLGAALAGGIMTKLVSDLRAVL